MDKSKIVLIVGVVLIIVSFAISAISIMNMTATVNKLNQLNNQEVVDETETPEKIPLEQISVLFYEDKIIIVLPSTTYPDKKVNVVFQVGFGVDSKNKTSADFLVQLGEKKDVIINRISKMMAKKSGDDFMVNNAREIIEREIYDLMIAEFAPESLIEVYVKNLLYTLK